MMDEFDVVEMVITGPRTLMRPHAIKLVEARLIACAQVADVSSTYRCDGQVETEDEARAVLDTTRANISAVSEITHRDHPYDVPCILVIPVEPGSPDYLQ